MKLKDCGPRKDLLFLSAVLCAYLIGCGPREFKGFAEDVHVPPGMAISNFSFTTPWGKQSDPQMEELYSLWEKPTSLTGSEILVRPIPHLSDEDRQLLLRHLETSCKWRVSEDRGKVIAVRRTIDKDGNWSTSKNGFRSGLSPSGKWYQTRTLINLDPAGWNLFETHQVLDKAGKAFIRVQKDNQGNKSHVRVPIGSLSLDVFEETPIVDRRFTQAQIDCVVTELQAVRSSVTAKQRGFDLALMPGFSAHTGKAEMVVRLSDIRGIYFVDAFVNPGEPGKCVVKAFEATKNIRLSENRMNSDSLEYVGWSSNPSEKFFYDSEITIFEGDWNSNYPARIELWFEPSDRSKPQRKLLEGIYNIEHWGAR